MTRLSLVLALGLVACSSSTEVTIVQVADAGRPAVTETSDGGEVDSDAPGVDAAAFGVDASAYVDASRSDSSDAAEPTEPVDAGTDAAEPVDAARPVPDAAPVFTCVRHPEYDVNCKPHTQKNMFLCTDGDAGAACPGAGDVLVQYIPADGTSWCCAPLSNAP